MQRWFNTAGPCKPGYHYMLPPGRRNPQVRGLIDQMSYFVLHAPRQTGKTTVLHGLNVESLTLSDFSLEEVSELYAQHTADTGQRFEPEAIARAHALTQGQPWLVNAIARQAVEVLRPDRREPITVEDVDLAARTLIERQDTHLDSLSARLREDRVRAVIEPMLAGETLGDVPRDDQRFVVDLGLVRWSRDGGLEVANPIYREVIVRELASGPRARPMSGIGLAP